MKRPLALFLLAAATGLAPVAGRAGEPDKVIRLGMIGLDTSHVIAFTRYLNDPKNATGCRVVAGYPGGSPDFPASANRVENFTRQLRDEYGLKIVDSIEKLCETVDGVPLERVDGRPHLEQAAVVIRAGKPLFVDKPMADDLGDVIEIFAFMSAADESKARDGAAAVSIQELIDKARTPRAGSREKP